MASLPGGLGFELHIAGEVKSKAVSARFMRLCMVGWLGAGQLFGLSWMYGL
jgi:hypothetical protein